MGNSTDHEKEIKLEVSDFDAVIKSLKENGAEFLGNAFQKTIRFDDENKGLEKQGIFLRVRSGFENVITMKIKVKNDTVFERKEIELHIEDIEKMRKIIKKLGFEKEFIMEKYRSRWVLDGVDISLDELPFGLFIELEGDENKIFEVAKKLNLDTSKRIIVTYWDIFDKYKEKTGKTGEDIEFERDYKSKIIKIA